MTKDAVTNWNLLPGNPLEFFGLEPDFEVRDLRRSYGRLIKRFKPESHPSEFQQIRQAYELLESQNRYGVQMRAQAVRDDAWESFASLVRRETPKSGSASEVPTGPGERYRYMKGKLKRSPQEYYQLAVLSDVFERNDPMIFLKWLLTGLNEHPSDMGLQQLILNYLHMDLKLEDAERILASIAKVTPAPIFYRITEGLWLRYLREQPFEKYSKVLELCQRQLKSDGGPARTVFMIRLLRTASCTASLAWLKEQLSAVEQAGADIHEDLEQELNFVQLIVEYREKVPRNPSQMETRIQEMIHDYCTLPLNQATGQVAACFSEMARDVKGLMDAFDVTEKDRCEPLINICCYLAGDCLNHIGGANYTSNAKDIRQHAISTVQDMIGASSQVVGRINRRRMMLIGGPMLGCVFGLPILTGFLVPSNLWLLGVVGSFVCGIVLFAAWLKPFVLEKYWRAKVGKLLLAEYSRSWRARLLRYVQACHAPLEKILSAMAQEGEHVGYQWVTDLVAALSLQDIALHLLSLSQRFER
jgi:hypothetical protein